MVHPRTVSALKLQLGISWATTGCLLESRLESHLPAMPSRPAEVEHDSEHDQFLVGRFADWEHCLANDDPDSWLDRLQVGRGMNMHAFVDRVGFVGALSLFRMTPIIRHVDRSLATAVSAFIDSISTHERDEFDQALGDIEGCSTRIGPSQVVFLDREFYVHTVAILCGYVAHVSVPDRARLIRTVAADFWSSIDRIFEHRGSVPGLELDDTLEGIEMRWLDRDWNAFQAPSGLSMLYDARMQTIVGTFDTRERIASHVADVAGWA